jgi:hypothetical protein
MPYVGVADEKKIKTVGRRMRGVVMARHSDQKKAAKRR